MATILYVRIKSALDSKELDRRLDERKPRFLEIPGLIQKIYGRDEETGDVCGIYFLKIKKHSQLSAILNWQKQFLLPMRRQIFEGRSMTLFIHYDLRQPL